MSISLPKVSTERLHGYDGPEGAPGQDYHKSSHDYYGEFDLEIMKYKMTLSAAIAIVVIIGIIVVTVVSMI